MMGSWGDVDMATSVATTSSTSSSVRPAAASNAAQPNAAPRPVFGFLAFTSGSFEGAIVRDMRLANELHRRGFKVVVYWMMDRNGELVDSGIRQRVLCSAMRFQFRGR